MRHRTGSAPNSIVPYLTVMFMLESAMNGFMTWAYREGDRFDTDFFALLNSALQRQSDQTRFYPTLGTLQTFLREAASGGIPLQSHETAKLRQALGEMARVFSELPEQRNRTMHGRQPSIPLESDADIEGIARKIAILFHLILRWIQRLAPIKADQQDLFDGYRYLRLREVDILEIAYKGQQERRQLNIWRVTIPFHRFPLTGAYNVRQRRFEQHSRPGELWVSSRPVRLPRRHAIHPHQQLVRAWLGNWEAPNATPIVVTNSKTLPAEFGMIPFLGARESAGENSADEPHLFDVPAWVRGPKRDQHLRILIEPRA